MWLTRTCSAERCRTIAEHASEFCLAHKNYRAEKEQRRLQAQPWLRWYSLAIWRRLRHMCLSRNPMCVWEGCELPATDVDHIIPHKGNWDLFTTLENLQGLCKAHHSEKTAMENAGFGGSENERRR